ncbi:MAG TPA: hypothetical protein PLL20_15620 [Phycisphaerae bacterium]|nr:hypothetical protein [Phycisphaerae bacterium]HRR84625.1 hypothetical protein [Phycisphaerae bacterium]
MAGKKKAILLRIPQDLWDSLNRWSRDDLRSLNGQIEFILREAVRRRAGGRTGESPRDDQVSDGPDVEKREPA